MKNLKIFQKDWVKLHPYTTSDPVDAYYVKLANQIYSIMEQTELINSFNPDETKEICVRIAAYFEDVISGLGIWRAFIRTHLKLFGKYLPFYTTDDHYYDDEVNLEDVRFLLWHYTQQYHGFRKGTFVGPDNPTNEITAQLIYDVFCDEWTTAPDNPRMKRIFDRESRYENYDTYRGLLTWFHYACYLLTDTNDEFTEFAKGIWNETKYNQAKRNELVIQANLRLACTSKTALLALTSPQWLALILPEDHPDHAFFEEIANDSVGSLPEAMTKENQAFYEKFTQAADGKLLLYFEKVGDVKTFITETANIIPADRFQIPSDWLGKKLALYATPQEGVQVICSDVDLIKDENNPFYNAARAEKQALSFFIVKHCNAYLLEKMMERGMLADAQTKSLVSPERGKEIIQDNWRFLSRYFLREYPIEAQ